jgi:hypothetical protein
MVRSRILSAVDDMERIGENVVELVRAALPAASGAEDLRDCARAAASTGDRALMREVAARIGQEVEVMLASSSAWEAEALYNKLDAWRNSGFRATVLAEAWGFVRPGVTATAR